MAAGVAKAHSDVVLISGHDGGTGASPPDLAQARGHPWELGLAETQQTLVLNKLRDRIVVQTDGQAQDGPRRGHRRPPGGTEEFGFATAPAGCDGMHHDAGLPPRHLPSGDRDPESETPGEFQGKAEHVVFFKFVAEEVREIMAKLGFRTVAEMIGRSDLLDKRKAIEHYKAQGLDFSKIFYRHEVGPEVSVRKIQDQDHGIEASLDWTALVPACENTLKTGEPVSLEYPIRNVNRTVGTILGSEVTRKYGSAGLPDDTIKIKFKGSAGQSFGAFLPPGMTLTLDGDANDYAGKGLSGGKIVIYPPKTATFVPEDNVIIGNVALYGATSGRAFFRGRAGERFCVPGTAAMAVVEGTGDHACEYMTGGVTVVIGATGRNFAAGMSGGMAFVFDEAGDFYRAGATSRWSTSNW